MIVSFYCDVKLYFDISSVLELEMNCYRYAIILIILYRVRNWYYQHFYVVSVRYLYRFQSKVFFPYFSHHKPFAPFLEYDTEEDINLQNLCLFLVICPSNIIDNNISIIHITLYQLQSA